METTDHLDNDPRGWSIDQVVNELCHSTNPQWLPNNLPQSHYTQNRRRLEETLRENHIDGDSLMALDMVSLKEDLGVVSFGIRNIIMRAVKFFQGTSQSYQQHDFQADSFVRMQTTNAFPSPQITQPRASMIPQSPYYGMGIQPSIESWHTRSPSLTSGFGQPRQFPPDPPAYFFTGPGFIPPRPADTSSTTAQPPHSHWTEQIEQPPHSHRTEQIEQPPHSHRTEQIEQPHSSSAVTNPGPSGAIEQVMPKDHDEPMHSKPERPKREHTVVNGKKKIAPTFIRHLPEDTQVTHVETAKGNYLSFEALPLQEIFYYKVPTEVPGEDFYRVAVDESVEFGISSQYPSGQRLAIGRFLKSFLRQGTITSSHGGMRVMLPYGTPRVKEPFKISHSEQYFTLFMPGDERPKVRSVGDYPDLAALHAGEKSRKRRRLTAGSFGTSEHPTNPGQVAVSKTGTLGSDFDYLLAKYPAEDSDEALPVYGDSGDENDYDEDTWREMEEEKAAAAQCDERSATLTPDQVNAAINEAIEELKIEWREIKLAAVQRKAYRHWMEAARNKSRQPKIEYFNRFRDHCSQRMDKLRREVAGNVWRNVAEVKKQCQVLEVTIHQHQEYNYYSQVMLHDAAPENPTREALARAKVSTQHDLEEGEEVIESEQDAISESDEDGFIDDDSADVASIHHEPDAEEWEPIIPQAAPAVRPTTANDEPSSDAHDSPILETPMPDVDADDADIESDDDIITPSRRRGKHVKVEAAPQTPTPNRRKLTSRSMLSFAKDPNSSDNSDLDRTPRLPQSKYREQGRSSTLPVDLTADSPPSGPGRITHESSTDFSIHTPELNPIRRDMKKVDRSHVRLSAQDSDSDRISVQDDTNLPMWDYVQGIRDTNWSDIEAADTRRVLAKAVYELESYAVTGLMSLLKTLSTQESRERIIVNGLAGLSADVFLAEGVRDKHQSSAEVLVLLYLAHCLGENTLDEYFDVSPHHINQAYEDKDTATEPFYGTLEKILRALRNNAIPKKCKKRKRALSDFTVGETEAEVNDDISSDPLPDDVPPSSHKKRKRKVEESQEANSQQYSDKLRIQQQEQRRKNMANRLTAMQMDGTAQVIVNTEEPLIQLHEQIAARIKPHQINGLQFMWREIIEDRKHQGCILAHTMGLGKTMQVASLLVTISLCNQSDDSKVRDLVPEHLRNGKTLVLCPPSLLNNWEDELLMWRPDWVDLGEIYRVDSKKKEENVRYIQNWSNHGGILLMGYDRFRRSCTGSTSDKGKGKQVFVDLEAILLNEPGLVIADEAHTLKNPKSRIAQIARLFKTKSRIALTGSPLNNHLEEYHAMVDWIAPNYLGTIVNFRDKYSEPIEAGLYVDSTAADKRTSLRKLHVLKRDLDPKISRADITAIEKDMPSKTEFFITIPLTELQRQAYDVFVTSLLQSVGSGRVRGGNATMWDWIAMLGWLCHHPAGFVRKLEERKANKANGDKLERGQKALAEDPSESSDETSAPEEGQTPSVVNDDVVVDDSGPLGAAMQKALEILPRLDDLEALDDPVLSYRTIAVKRIVEKAIEAGDKTLIFSHSIPTLNYLSGMLTKMKCPFRRITGETQVSDRQDYTKQFNETNKYKVLLISMRAGGLGLNIQGANRVIIFDFSFNPTWEQQAIGRAYRLNQKRPVFVYRFRAGGTFEDRLFNTSVFKTNLFGRVVDKKNPRRHASKTAHTDYLFPAKDIPQEDFAECIGKDPKVLDAVIHELDFIRSIVLTETFQKEEEEHLTKEEQKAAEEEFEDQRLQRENPAAWRLKQATLIAERRKEQQAMYAVPPSTMPNMASHHANALHASTSSGARRSTQSALTQPPFSKDDFRQPQLPQRPQPVQNMNPAGMRGSFDDTFTAFGRQWDDGDASSANSDLRS